jgi:hypothetical protein
MSTTNAFAYNTGSPIDGTTQVGDLSVGTPTSGFTSSPQYWNGPDQNVGYVIAKPVSGNTQPSPIIVSSPTKLLTLSNDYIGWDISLSNGNQTATQQFGYQQTVLGNAQIDPNSKIMFSVLFNTSAPGTLAGSHVIGIGKTSMKYKGTNGVDSAYPGIDGESMGYCADGTILFNGSVYLGGLNTWTDNDVIDIVIDNNVNGMWVRVNGGYWNNNDGADPASNAFGIEIIGGPFYPALCPAYEGVMVIQNSAEYGVPTGYTLLGSNETASVGFIRSDALTDNSFIELTNSYFNQSFTASTDASDWLTSNGYWNSYGNLSSLTINPSDFTEGGPIYQNTFGVGTNGVDGFVNTAAQGNFLEGYYGAGLTSGAISTISAAITQAGLDPNSNTGYIWSVTWGAGSSISSGYVKFGYYEPGGYFDIQTVDPSDTDWQLPGYNNGTSLAGTFLFPATFTQYQPLTNKGGWC